MLLNKARGGKEMANYMFVNGELYNADELMHYGVPGMKWGKRNVRGHAGPGRYLTKKRQLAGDKKDLEYLNKGGHLSVGLTKKRQAAYDAKDKVRLEKRIAKTEASLHKKSVANAEKKKAKQKARENRFVDNYKTYLSKELKKVSKDLDQPYRQEIGNGKYADWPSKRKFLESEIDRVTRKQKSGQKLKDYYIGGKQYLLT